MNPGCRVRDQLNTSEPTAPYIIGRELNLRKTAGRQWESCPQPYEQLRPKTIKTSTSTESATTAYNCYSQLSLCNSTRPNTSDQLGPSMHGCVREVVNLQQVRKFEIFIYIFRGNAMRCILDYCSSECVCSSVCVCARA